LLEQGVVLRRHLGQLLATPVCFGARRGITARVDLLLETRKPQLDRFHAVEDLLRESASTDLVVHEPSQPPQTLGEVDVVFPLLHGPFGEDGTLQGMLELSDIRYVGSGVLASAVMMDKHYMKLVFTGHGLPVGPFVVISDRQWQQDPAAAMDAVASLGWPVFVKPARAGSSIGITRVTDWSQFPEAVATAAAHDRKVVVEAAVPGREIEIGVLARPGGGLPDTSLPAEIRLRPGTEWYDFDAKYLEDAVEFDVPARLTPEQTAAVQETARRAFLALDCAGLARVDFFLATDPETGADRWVVNEVNTMPGFTETSVYAKLWQASGLEYPTLCDRLVTLAAERHQRARSYEF